MFRRVFPSSMLCVSTCNYPILNKKSWYQVDYFLRLWYGTAVIFLQKQKTCLLTFFFLILLVHTFLSYIIFNKHVGIFFTILFSTYFQYYSGLNPKPNPNSNLYLNPNCNPKPLSQPNPKITLQLKKPIISLLLITFINISLK